MMMLPAAQSGTRQRTHNKAIISALLISRPVLKWRHTRRLLAGARASLPQIPARGKTQEASKSLGVPPEPVGEPRGGSVNIENPKLSLASIAKAMTQSSWGDDP
jgi:hypothetical protein